MSNFSAIYVQLLDNSEAAFEEVNRVLKEKGYLFTLRYHQSKPWVQLWAEEAENLSYYVGQIRAFFPQQRIIAIACQSVVDAIAYYDVQGDNTYRVLEYGFRQERTWEKVEGIPQAWESEIFSGREGYQAGDDLKVGEITPFFTNFDIQQLGQLLDLSGFGTPDFGENWTREIFN
ncbi:MAG: hypothetical protein GQ569_06755 [Methylococcaceae bacterium]|nr:hypothetical protein [Methylococcaceae bacterium]